MNWLKGVTQPIDGDQRPNLICRNEEDDYSITSFSNDCEPTKLHLILEVNTTPSQQITCVDTRRAYSLIRMGPTYL